MSSLGSYRVLSSEAATASHGRGKTQYEVK